MSAVSVLSSDRNGMIFEFLGSYYFCQLEKGKALLLYGILTVLGPEQIRKKKAKEGSLIFRSYVFLPW